MKLMLVTLYTVSALISVNNIKYVMSDIDQSKFIVNNINLVLVRVNIN